MRDFIRAVFVAAAYGRIFAFCMEPMSWPDSWPVMRMVPSETGMGAPPPSKPNEEYGPEFYPMQVTCKGQALGGVLDREYNLEHTTGFGGSASCYVRGSCNHPKWIGNGVLPDADHPAGPVKRVVALTHPQWGSFYHFLVESMPRMY